MLCAGSVYGYIGTSASFLFVSALLCRLIDIIINNFLKIMQSKHKLYFQLVYTILPHCAQFWPATWRVSAAMTGLTSRNFQWGPLRSSPHSQCPVPALLSSFLAPPTQSGTRMRLRASVWHCHCDGQWRMQLHELLGTFSHQAQFGQVSSSVRCAVVATGDTVHSPSQPKKATLKLEWECKKHLT